MAEKDKGQIEKILEEIKRPDESAETFDRETTTQETRDTTPPPPPKEDGDQ